MAEEAGEPALEQAPEPAPALVESTPAEAEEQATAEDKQDHGQKRSADEAGLDGAPEHDEREQKRPNKLEGNCCRQHL